MTLITVTDRDHHHGFTRLRSEVFLAHNPAADALSHPQVKGVDVLLTVDEVATIYCLRPATITWKCRRGTFTPLPVRKYPYRWRKSDIERDIATHQDERYAKHGFATKKFKPVKAKATKATPKRRKSA